MSNEKTRPCETTIACESGLTIKPDFINRLASGGSTFAKFLMNESEHMTKDEILKVAAAILDNWNRFYDSC